MDDKTLRITIGFFITYIFFGWIFSRTVYSSSLAVYICFGTLLILFMLAFVSRSRKIRVNGILGSWLFYLLLTICGYLIQTKFEYFSYWTICLIIICLIPRIDNYHTIFAEKLLLLIGIFSCIGLLSQLFLPSLYNAYIAPLFLNRDILSLASGEYGLSGFTYQMDTSAMPILYAEGIYLFCTASRKKISKRRILIMALFFAFCVILTGKRLLMVIAIAAPIIVYVVSLNSFKKRIIVIIGSVATLILAYNILIFFAPSLINVPYFGRLVRSLMNYKVLDVTSGRTDLYRIAIALFKSNPLFGIGVGNFASVSGAKTDVHNTYLQVLCEQGIIGFIPYILGIVSTIIYTISILRNEDMSIEDRSICKFSVFVQIIYVIYSFTGNLNTNMFGYCIYFYSISFLPCIVNKNRKETSYDYKADPKQNSWRN